ncbi:MAG: hypothetical protein AAGF75_13215, partial [Cyanobacteria bacterium P01_H01_bin.130]
GAELVNEGAGYGGDRLWIASGLPPDYIWIIFLHAHPVTAVTVQRVRVCCYGMRANEKENDPDVIRWQSRGNPEAIAPIPDS